MFNSRYYQLIIEALVVGVIVVLVGTFSGFVISKFIVNDMPPVCKDWNKNFIMELSLFFTGVVTHILFELMGGNKWYCKNGFACKN